MNVEMKISTLEKIVEYTRKDSEKELFGVLIGSFDGEKFRINAATTGTSDIDSLISKMKEKSKDEVIGWYHSNPGYGALATESDIEVGKKIGKSELVALMIDPVIGKRNFLRYHNGALSTILPSDVNLVGKEEPVKKRKEVVLRKEYRNSENNRVVEYKYSDGTVEREIYKEEVKLLKPKVGKGIRVDIGKVQLELNQIATVALIMCICGVVILGVLGGYALATHSKYVYMIEQSKSDVNSVDTENFFLVVDTSKCSENYTCTKDSYTIIPKK